MSGQKSNLVIASIEDQWKILVAMLYVPALDPASIQYRELRKAFFAGFTAAFHGCLTAASQEPEPDVVKHWDRLQNEIEAFEATLQKEMALYKQKIGQRMKNN